jgi:beta-galactosidase
MEYPTLQIRHLVQGVFFMKMKSLCLLIVLFGLGGLAFGNLIENGDFARGEGESVPGWSFRVFDPDKPLRGGVGEAGGRRYLYLAADGPGTHGKAGWGTRVPVVPGSSYALSFEVRGEVDDSGGDRIFLTSVWFADAEGKPVDPGNRSGIDYLALKQEKWPAHKVETSGAWETRRKSLTAPAGAAELVFQFNMTVRGADGRFELANVRLEQEEETVDDVLGRFPDRLGVYAVRTEPVTFKGKTLTPDWSAAGAPVRESRTRKEICLNALFAVQPGRLGEVPREGDWAFSKVPGIVRMMDAKRTGHVYGTGPTAIYGMDKVSWKDINRTPAASHGMWYLRDIEVPAGGAGGRWTLRFDNLKWYAGRVYVNGAFAGNLSPYDNHLDVSAHVLPGRTNQVMFFVLPVRSEKKYAHEVFAGKRQRYFSPNPSMVESGKGSDFHMAQIGMVDAVFLEHTPRDPVFQRVKVVPSWRERTLVFEVGLPEGMRGRVEDIRFALDVRPAAGDGEAAFEAAAPGRVEPTDNGVRLTYRWDNPRPWSAEDPFLYTFSLAAFDKAGRLLDETLPVRFGFREIWIDGRHVLLNGKELRQRPAFTLAYHAVPGTDALRRHFSFLKDMGFNTLKLWSEGSIKTPENSYPVRDVYRLADEMGLYVTVYTPYNLVSGGQFGTGTIETSPELLRYVDERLVRVVENHPSVIAYSGFGKGWHDGINYLQYRPDTWGSKRLDTWEAFQNLYPQFVAARPEEHESMRTAIEQSVAFIEGVKALDSTRPFFSHHDIGQSDSWPVYSYFNWTPMQEWEDWPMPWSLEGTMPIGSGEGGMPFLTSFANHGVPDGDREPWFAEYAASSLGERAYTLVDSGYLDQIRASYERHKPAFGGAYLEEYYWQNPIIQEFLATVSIPALYRSWRMYGVSLGMEPFGYPLFILPPEKIKAHLGSVDAAADDDVNSPGYKPDRHWDRAGHYMNFTMPGLPARPAGTEPADLNPAGSALRANNSDLLAFIAGRPGDPTSKDHVFASGEPIEKQIAIVWDAHLPRALKISWAVRRGETRVAGGEFDQELAGGDNLRLPLSFALETDKPGEEFHLEMEVRDPDGTHVATDTFALQVHGPRPLPGGIAGLHVVALDPAGEVGPYLRGLGVGRVETFDEPGAFAEALARLPGGSGGVLAVVGRRALGEMRKVPPSAWKEGVPVLVLEQDAATLEAAGFRAYPIRQRKAFPLDAGHPVLRDLGAAEFSDWRVDPKLIPAGVEPSRKGYNYRVHSRGAVAPVEIETPAMGPFTPLLQCGFDLNSSPLIEMTSPRVIFCQLPLLDAGEEPAARRLAENLLDYLAQPPHDTSASEAPSFWHGLTDRVAAIFGRAPSTPAAPPARATALAGSASDREFLRKLGVHADAALASAPVIVFGDTEEAPGPLLERVSGGATLVVLPDAITRHKEALEAQTGASIETTTTFFEDRSEIGNDPAFAHVGQNSLHFRQPLPVFRINGQVLARTPHGSGSVIWIGFDPRRLDVEAGPYLRLTQRRMVRALTQILQNAGADFTQSGAAIFGRIAGNRGAGSLDVLGLRIAPESPGPVPDDWADAGFDDSAWPAFDLARVKTPRPVVHLRGRFHLPAGSSGNLVADLGTFDDYDVAYLNGQEIGTVHPGNSDPAQAWQTRRLYPLPPEALRPGQDNVIAIKTWKRDPAANPLVRGPLRILPADQLDSDLYFGTYRISDDPYLQRHW